MNIVLERFRKSLLLNQFVENGNDLKYGEIDILLDFDKEKNVIKMDIVSTVVGRRNEYLYDISLEHVYNDKYLKIKIDQIIKDVKVFKLLIEGGN